MNTNVLLIVFVALNVALVIFSILTMFAKASIGIIKAVTEEDFKINFKTELYVAFVCTFGAVLGSYFLI